MYRSGLFLAFCSVLSLCEAQAACDIRSLYTRLLADAALADSFCADLREGPHLSTQFMRLYGDDCYDAYRKELGMGCSIFEAARRLMQPVTETVTVTSTAETTTFKEFVYPWTPTSSSVHQSSRTTPALYVSAASDQRFGNDAQRQQVLLSILTSTTSSSFSKMTAATTSKSSSSTLSTTTTLIQSTVSSLAAPSPTATGRCIPTPLPPAVDRHVFTPLVDLSLEQSSATVAEATTVDDPQDPNSENCDPYSVVYLPEEASTSCVHLTGSWAPLYTDVYYECVARTQAPNFDPRNSLEGVAGFNFTANDDSHSLVNMRHLGPRPESGYRESTLTLFVPKEKTYTVDFWACGAGTTLIIGELSCTYHG
ncbi:hypothetical protein HRR83_008809 [Exophiala dermatitidis]|nr:hypothetical protein HRR73_009014 [Exophiala dermatitidis]KAJ4506243.1 hypothetical protein HRR75_007098 [Exophiala dermatitidis]KAJ4508337.1 hypothetical protein HRR74_007736 [Exophiala dermatitidis]KAJ4538332.1 hypothetical protein HRR78_008216 [Exophiala dermatitidis]KAJ4563082.1 hypothetical protein HRR81_008677 [Exophiala dermatitidis]